MTNSTAPQTDNDFYNKYDPFRDEYYPVPRVPADGIVIVHMVAEFKTIKAATEFASRYLHSGRSSEANARQEKRVVRWDAVMDGTEAYRVQDYVTGLLENVEYIGGMSARLGFSRTDSEPIANLRPLYRSY